MGNGSGASSNTRSQWFQMSLQGLETGEQVIGRKCKCDRGVIFGLFAEPHFGEWENGCYVGA